MVNSIRTSRGEGPVNHKRVLRIMKQNDLLNHAYKKKTGKYNSYEGVKVGNGRSFQSKVYDRMYFTENRN
ncbi:hypothetical protein FHL02_07830 [Lactobacillus salsicarnum]|uniref:Uncharacterized protein n=1 Tax=Companilactobacillus mishanensis TaxID=2486008 RepID=A0A5P0ZIR7_9LACO|nr:hypothetical protein [Companilactobacillus mishanensis]